MSLINPYIMRHFFRPTTILYSNLLYTNIYYIVIQGGLSSDIKKGYFEDIDVKYAPELIHSAFFNFIFSRTFFKRTFF